MVYILVLLVQYPLKTGMLKELILFLKMGSI